MKIIIHHETKKGYKLDNLFVNILSLWKVKEGYGPAMVFHKHLIGLMLFNEKPLQNDASFIL